MITKLEQIAVDPYTRRVMEEEEFMAMNIDFWKKAISKRDSIIANKDSIIAALNAKLAQINKEIEEFEELEEYRRRYGKLNDTTN